MIPSDIRENANKKSTTSSSVFTDYSKKFSKVWSLVNYQSLLNKFVHDKLTSDFLRTVINGKSNLNIHKFLYSEFNE